MESQHSGAGRGYIRRFGSKRQRPSKRQFVIWALWLFCGAMLWTGAVQAQSTSYVYDANGRVVAVTVNNGTSAQYGYDTLGHAGPISAPLSSTQLAIFAFTPTHGVAGTQVTIQGQGFDGNAAHDTVSFNGTAATIVSATSSQLVATVPSGATTGPIGVVADGQTATSAASFVVDDTGEPPTITQVSPLAVAVGSTVTVTGTHLDPVAGQTVMLFGNRDVSAGSSIGDSQILHTVSSSDASGFITVSTPYGQAISAAPIIVLPSGVSAANVVSSEYASVGGSANLSIGAGGQSGVLLFNGNGGDWISLQLSAITTTASTISYAVYSPGNQLILQGTVSSSSPSIHLPQLLTGGAYLVTFTPNDAGAQLTVGIESAALIGSGTPVTVVTATPGETKRLLFQGTLGQTTGFLLNNVSTTPAGQAVSYTVYNPGQESISSGSASSDGSIGLSPLPNTGTYQLVLGPGSGTTMSVEVVPGLLGAMTENGGAHNYATSVGGQSMYVYYSPNAGDNLELMLSNLSVTGGSSFNVNVYGPTGTNVLSFTCNVSSVICRAALWNMTAGVYTLVISPPSSSATLSVSAQISTDIVGPVLTPNTPVSVNLPVNTVERYTFNANEGDTYALQLSGVTGQPLSINVYSPATGTITTADFYTTFSTSSSQTINLSNLPATGTYTLVVYGGTGGPSSSAQLTLASSVTGTMTTNGPAQNYTDTVAGQNIYVNFSPSVGANLDLTLSNLSVTGGGSFNINVYDPNGSNVLAFTCNVSSINCRAALWNLVSGTYTMIVSPPSSTASISFAPQITQEIMEGALALNTPVTVNLNVNQVVRYTFSANAGDTGTLQLSGVTGQSMSVNVYSPTTSPITTANAYATFTATSSQTLNLSNLPATGIYTLVVYPGTSTSSSSAQLTLLSR